ILVADEDLQALVARLGSAARELSQAARAEQPIAGELMGVVNAMAHLNDGMKENPSEVRAHVFALMRFGWDIGEVAHAAGAIKGLSVNGATAADRARIAKAADAIVKDALA